MMWRSYTLLLRWWILGEGVRIKLQEPGDLRQKIERTLKEAGQYYLTATKLLG